MNGRARGLAIGGSAAAHLALLAWFAVQAPHLAPREEPAMDVLIVPVMLAPRLRPALAPQPRRSAPRRASRPDQDQGRPTAAPAPSHQPAPAPTLGAHDLPPGVRAALRRQTDCAERSGLRLAKDERGDCDERLGKGALAAPYLKAPIAPEIRQYWDAVAEAKSSKDLPTPPIARQRLGAFAAPGANMKGHGPGIGCHIDIGPKGLKVQRPAHGLKLGPLPCFIVPPAGSLSPDVDVQNPDEVVPNKPH
jgi:hypothetical protein